MDTWAWLFIHGYLVWLAGTVVCGLLAVVWAVRWRPRWRARRIQRRAKKTLGDAGTRLPLDQEGEVVTVRGKLKIHGEPCRRFEDGAEAAVAAAAVDATTGFPAMVTRQASGLSLVVAGVDVTLDGDVALLCGSEELLSRQGLAQLPAEVTRRVRQAGDGDPFLPEQPVVLRSILAGQTARVSGRLAPVEDPQGGYRDQPGWRLLPRADGPDDVPMGEAIQMISERSPRARVLSMRPALRAAAVAMTCFVVLALLVGEIAHGFGLGEQYTRFFVRAFTPLGRQAAVEEVRELPAWRYWAVPRLFELQLAVNEQLGRCQDNFKGMSLRRQFSRVVAHARRCPGHPQPVAEALYALGRFREASLLLSRSRPLLQKTRASERVVTLRARIHILAGRHGEAARDLKQRMSSIKRFRDALPKRDRNDPVIHRSLLIQGCLATALQRLHAGRGAPRLGEDAEGNSAGICPMLHWQLWRDPGRRTSMQMVKDTARRLEYWREKTIEFMEPELLLVRPIRTGLQMVTGLGLDRAALEEEDDEGASGALMSRRLQARWRISLHLAATMLALGQVAEARRYQARALALANRATVGSGINPLTAFTRAHMAALEASQGRPNEALQILQKGTSPYERTLRTLLAFQRKKSPVARAIKPILERWGGYDDGVWWGLATGDGDYLLGVLRYGFHFEAAILQLGAHRLTGARERLRHWVRWSGNQEISEKSGACLRCALVDRVGQLSRRIILARATQDDRLLGQLRAVGRRYAAALSKRRTSALLTVLENLPSLEQAGHQDQLPSQVFSGGSDGFLACRKGLRLGHSGGKQVTCKRPTLHRSLCVAWTTRPVGPLPVTRCNRAMFEDPWQPASPKSYPCWSLRDTPYGDGVHEVYITHELMTPRGFGATVQCLSYPYRNATMDHLTWRATSRHSGFGWY